jgi:hypothetical protein
MLRVLQFSLHIKNKSNSQGKEFVKIRLFKIQKRQSKNLFANVCVRSRKGVVKSETLTIIDCKYVSQER